MYTSFYQLKIKPFQICSDPLFMWLGDKHKEALSTLRYGILDNKGFLLLTGDVGTGKTTLINTLIMSLSTDVIYASVPDPRLEKLDFFNFIARAFGINEKFSTKGEFLAAFANFLHNAYDSKKKILLIIDEAQLLTQDMLEEIRLLSNINKPDSHLLNIFFVGQNEFNEILTRPENRAVAQRLTLNYNISPLTLEETGKYIHYRLRISGTTKKIFDDTSISEIFAYSGGFPRRINIICDHCLLTGFAKEKKSINSAIVKDCARDLKIPEYSVSPQTIPPSLPQPAPPEQPKKTNPFPISSLIGLVTVTCLFLVVFFFYNPNYFTTAYNNGFTYYNAIKSRFSQTAAGQPKAITEPEAQPEKAHPKKKKAADELSEKLRLEPVNAPEAKTIPSTPAETTSTDPTRQAEIKAPDSTNPSLQRVNHNEDSEISEAAQPNPPFIVPDIAAKDPTETEEREIKILPKVNAPTDPPQQLGHREIVATLPDITVVVRFDHNSNDISGSGIEKLDSFAWFLRSYPKAVSDISGYSDSIGTETYNIKLSKFRANIVKSFLLGRGVPAEQMKIRGLGSKNPVDSNDTVEGRMMNRRVELKVTKQQIKN